MGYRGNIIEEKVYSDTNCESDFLLTSLHCGCKRELQPTIRSLQSSLSTLINSIYFIFEAIIRLGISPIELSWGLGIYFYFKYIAL